MQPGDVLLIRGNGLAGQLLRWGQSMNGNYSEWDHCALYVDDTGTLVEALVTGISVTHEDKYREVTRERRYIDASPEDRAQAVRFAMARVGKRYNWVAAGGMLLARVTPIVFALNETETCSSLVARALERCKYDWSNPYRVTPGDIAATIL